LKELEGVFFLLVLLCYFLLSLVFSSQRKELFPVGRSLRRESLRGATSLTFLHLQLPARLGQEAEEWEPEQEAVEQEQETVEWEQEQEAV
jgi:hypothetical protein